MTTNPVHDAGCYFEKLQREAEAYEKEELRMSILFLDACMKRDVQAPAKFAPMVTDFAAPRMSQDGSTVKKHQTIAEVMDESLDYRKGPNKAELMQLLLEVAYGGNSIPLPITARTLIKNMAATWARYNVESV